MTRKAPRRKKARKRRKASKRRKAPAEPTAPASGGAPKPFYKNFAEYPAHGSATEFATRTVAEVLRRCEVQIARARSGASREAALYLDMMLGEVRTTLWCDPGLRGKLESIVTSALKEIGALRQAGDAPPADRPPPARSSLAQQSRRGAEDVASPADAAQKIAARMGFSWVESATLVRTGRTYLLRQNGKIVAQFPARFSTFIAATLELEQSGEVDFHIESVCDEVGKRLASPKLSNLTVSQRAHAAFLYEYVNEDEGGGLIRFRRLIELPSSG